MRRMRLWHAYRGQSSFRQRLALGASTPAHLIADEDLFWSPRVYQGRGRGFADSDDDSENWESSGEPGGRGKSLLKRLLEKQKYADAD